MNTKSAELIFTLESQLATAIQQGDLETLDALLHDDLLFVIPTGHLVRKEDDLQNFRSGTLQLEEVRIADHEFRDFGETVISSLVTSLSGTFAGGEIKGDFRYTRVWKKFGGDWKVIGGSGISLP